MRTLLLALLPLAACTSAKNDSAVDDTSVDTGAVDTADSGAVDTTDTSDTADTGTGSELVVPGFATALTQSGGCGDVALAAWNDDSTLVYTFATAGLVAEAYAAGGPVTRTWSFPIVGDAELPPDLVVQEGRYLTDAFCDDVIERPPEVVRTWIPVQGTLTLTITPSGTDPQPWDSPAEARLEHAYAAFVPADDPTAVPVEAGDVLIEARVGWLPG